MESKQTIQLNKHLKEHSLWFEVYGETHKPYIQKQLSIELHIQTCTHLIWLKIFMSLFVSFKPCISSKGQNLVVNTEAMK